MAYTVGQAEVDILPNAQGFQEKLSRQVTPAAQVVSRQVGDEFADQVADGIRRGVLEARARAGGSAATVDVDVDTAGALAKLVAFRAEAVAISRGTGEEAGSTLSRGIQQSVTRNSPVIVAAISGGLIAGAPAVLAASTLLFGGIAAAGAASNQQLQDQFHETAHEFTGVFQQAAQQTAPAFIDALQRIGTASLALRPQLDQLFGALNDPIDQLTTGVVNLLHNAMPGLVSAVQAATPVFQGLASFLGAIGTGISQFMTILAQHGPAAGQVFASLGQIVQNLLPALGELVGAGVELASDVLPPLAAALGVVNSVLHAIEPVLPAILAGFLGFKAVSLLDGPLSNLAGRLENLGGLGAKAGSALAGVGSALPALGIAVGILGFAFETAQRQVDDWATAINEGGAAADRAREEIDKQNASVQVLNTGMQGGLAHLLGYGTGLDIVANQGKRAEQAARDQVAAMTPLQQAQQAVTVAQNEYLKVLKDHAPTSGVAVAASYQLRDAQDALKQKQDALTLATNGVNASAQANELRLQGVATAAGSANTEINLLKGALDALTGTAVTMDQAQIAVTQATIAAQHALDGQRDAAGNLTSALTDTNGNLDLNTAAGAAASQAMINLAQTQHQEIATLEHQGASTDAVKQKTEELRQNFINQAKQMGLNDQAAHDLADRYFGMPDQVNTEITADTAPARGQLNKLITDFSQSPINLGVSIRTGRQAAADGGVLAGWSPGRDVHHFTSPTGGALDLSGGEAVMRPEFTAAVGSGWVNAMNSAARSGGAAGVRNAMGFASGGIVDFMRWMQLSAQVSPSSLSAARSQMTQLNSAPSFGGGGSGGYRDLGRQIAAAMGYANQFGAIDYIFSHESGWNPRAQNPTSTAYGIPQFLNATWAAYGGKTSDAAAQIRDGIKYMVNRYGSPNAAAAFWQGHHWYHDGGVVPGSPSTNVPAVLSGGETVRTPAQEAALRGGRAMVIQLDGSATQAFLQGQAVEVLVDAFTARSNRVSYSG